MLPTTDFAEEFQRRAQILIQQKKNIMQSYLKYKEYDDQKAKAAPLKLNDYCFILQPIAEIPFREFTWIGPYIIEKVLPNDNYIVRKLNSNKTQILHRIRLRKYEPNTNLQDDRPERSSQPHDEFVIPQDDIYVITWETNFGDFEYGRCNATNGLPDERLENTSDVPNEAELPDQILTDVDLRFTRRDTTESTLPDQILPASDDQASSDDKTSSGGRNTIVPEVLESENDDVIVENERPRGGKYNLRPKPTPNNTDEYRY